MQSHVRQEHDLAELEHRFDRKRLRLSEMQRFGVLFLVHDVLPVWPCLCSVKQQENGNQEERAPLNTVSHLNTCLQTYLAQFWEGQGHKKRACGGMWRAYDRQYDRHKPAYE